MIQLLLCDDDAQELSALASALTDYYGEDKARIAAFTGPEQALEYIENGERCDAAILDIIMPGMNGTALAAALRGTGFKGAIIFLTASRSYAPESYEVEALDYIIKPIEPARLARTLDRLEAWRNVSDHVGIVLTVEKTPRRTLLRDILYAEAGNHVTYFALEQAGRLTVRGNFSSYAPMLLADPRFAQCHGSFVVNMDKIQIISENDAALTDGRQIPIARRYSSFRKQYMKWMTREEDFI